jgi:hypothetical protein
MRKNFNEENENLKKKFDELFNEKINEIKFVDNRVLENYKLKINEYLDYYRKESTDYKKKWLKVDCNLNKELIRSKNLEQENKRLAEVLNVIKMKMSENEEILQKEIQELNEKLKQTEEMIQN